jgi:hypothetical protein
VRMLRSSSTKAIVGMSLLSKTCGWSGGLSSDAPHSWALNPVNEQCKLG